MNLDGKEAQLWLGQSRIESQIAALGKELEERYHSHHKLNDEKVIFIPVLTGALRFFGSLCYSLHFEYEVHPIFVNSYEGEQQVDLKVSLPPNFVTNINNALSSGKYHIYLVEDIIDSGNTIRSIEEFLTEEFNCDILKISALSLVSRDRFLPYPFQISYRSLFKVEEDAFIVGYGMDWNEKYRSLDNIYILS